MAYNNRTIGLYAISDWGFSGQYIAQIIGRHKKFTFNRKFIGERSGKRNETSSAIVDESGLYETVDSDNEGKNSIYYFIGELDGDFHKIPVTKQQAMLLAQELDTGREFDDCIEFFWAEKEGEPREPTWRPLERKALDSKLPF